MSTSLKVAFQLFEKDSGSGFTHICDVKQTVIELPDEEIKRVTGADNSLSWLRDLGAKKAALDAIKATMPEKESEQTPEQQRAYLEAFQQYEHSRAYLKELLIAAGDIISRFCLIEVEKYFSSNTPPEVTTHIAA